jgi:hypothetical protein
MRVTCDSSWHVPGLDITSLDVQLGQAVADVGWAYCTCHVGIPASIRCRCVHGQQCHDEGVTLAAATAQYRTAVLDSAVSYIVPFRMLCTAQVTAMQQEQLPMAKLA